MADILIRGMEMPKKGNPLTVLIYPDGTATWKDREYKAIPVPPHGRLIDADALKKRTPMVIDYSAGGFGTNGSIRPVRGYGDWQIDEAPTIVPAEGGTDDGNRI